MCACSKKLRSLPWMRYMMPGAMNPIATVAASNRKKLLTSRDLGTSPFSRPCCSLRGVGSSVFCALSCSSAMLYPAVEGGATMPPRKSSNPFRNQIIIAETDNPSSSNIRPICSGSAMKNTWSCGISRASRPIPT